ncbi:MAG TPA: sulfatase-like hydrolase/transferase, partial [Anaerolineales bacterium]|nr:sulfatase-like hydrolase/transferase [Anaerolineales bacterium]
QTLKASGTKIEKRGDLVNLVENNKVRNTLAQHGYQLISFHNEYKATISSAEIYYDDSQSGIAYPVTAFESILIDHSMARVLSHVPALNKALIEMPYDTHRRHIMFTFTKLQEVPALEGSYFVYAHLIAPHPPFVFDEEGAVVSHDTPFTLNDANYYIRDHSQRNYIAGYRRQIQYINELVLNTVDAILARSTTPPIIIIQGDHGPGAYLHWGSLENTLPAERFGILNAYYFPDQDYTRLYPSISPVNSFRVLFNQFFDADYALLPDQHYYSSWSFPFDFVEVTDVSLP